MPLGGLLPYGDEMGMEDDFDSPVVLDSGDLTDRVHQGADENLPEGEDGILALVRRLAGKRRSMMGGGAPGQAPPAMPEMNGQVQNRLAPGMAAGGGLGRALLSGFRG